MQYSLPVARVASLRCDWPLLAFLSAIGCKEWTLVLPTGRNFGRRTEKQPNKNAFGKKNCRLMLKVLSSEMDEAKSGLI